MSLATVHTRATAGLEAPAVAVEVHLGNGLPSLSIVGLPETAVREAKDRVRSALLNSGYEFPQRRITVNLAPADLPKEGSHLDLPIAMGLLAASGQVPAQRAGDFEFLGELALGGDLRNIRGVLPAALQCRRAGRALIVPAGNAAEAALVEGATVFGADHLLDVCAHLQDRCALTPGRPPSISHRTDLPDLSEVRGQHAARRALEVAAAGGHSLLMVGPPGTGKTMLASRLPGILPPMDEQEAVEAAAIASLSHMGFRAEEWRRRPFRAPHHTASAVALVGGGTHPRPGEVSLAHGGILFLDELPEFDRRVLEVLREPLESGRITISRAARQADFPARFQLIASMNPCPCGYHGHPSGRCRCTPDRIRRYREKLSGPLLDRIDLHIEVPALAPGALCSTAPGESSATVRARVSDARARQQARQMKPNAELGPHQMATVCPLKEEDAAFLEKVMERLQFSARGHDRILKVARTIADLDGRNGIRRDHLMEALHLRRPALGTAPGVD